MTAYFSFIGDLNDPKFCWDNPQDLPTTATNLPNRLVPTKRFTELGVSVFFVMDQIKNQTYEGKQLDWGAWGLKMSGRQLQALLAKYVDEFPELQSLESEKHYVLVAGEYG